MVFKNTPRASTCDSSSNVNFTAFKQPFVRESATRDQGSATASSSRHIDSKPMQRLTPATKEKRKGKAVEVFSWYEKGGGVKKAKVTSPQCLDGAGKQEGEKRTKTNHDVDGEITKSYNEIDSLGRSGLPILRYQQNIALALKRSDILILVGETGSGKSTQIGQFLVNQTWNRIHYLHMPKSGHIGTSEGSDDEDYGNWYGFESSAAPSAPGNSCKGKAAPQSGKTQKVGGSIAITQPRRIAAVSLARRVSSEMNTEIGQEVGYSVRFDACFNRSKTKIKFLTDGMLLQELLSDPLLSQYSCVVVDEAHERSINTDLLLGFLKDLIKPGGPRAGNLKVVIMSATVEVERMKEFFSSSPEAGNENSIQLCEVEGRQYPVDIFYTPTPVQDYIDASLRTIFQIHYSEPLPGDILVFLTGQEEIETLSKLIVDISKEMDGSVPKVEVLPLYAALPIEAQQRIFEAGDPRTRRIVLATNVAETSITVPRVRYVVDSGKVKTKNYRPMLGFESLLITPISKSSAVQRCGRAGREAPGKCYRLYTQATYESLEARSAPEILRSDISSTLLAIKCRGVKDPFKFDFISRPAYASVLKGLETLYQLSALDARGEITDIGKRISRLPLIPSMGRALLEAEAKGVLPEVIDIVSLLSTENIFLNSTDEESQEPSIKARQHLQPPGCSGDHMLLLNVIRSFILESKNARRGWCDAHLLSLKSLRLALEIRKQLFSLMSCNPPQPDEFRMPSEVLKDVLHCFAVGFPNNVARMCLDGKYRTIFGGQDIAIHPSSSIWALQKKAQMVVYSECIFTTRTFARWVSPVEESWL